MPSALTPTPEAAAAAAAMTPAPATAPTAVPAVKVETPPPRPVLSQLQADQAAGGRSPFPPGQRFNSRGEAIRSDLAPTSPAVVRGFAGANKIVRLPDGTLVDGNGNPVQQPPLSALFPR
jgi:hypothetical protein